MTKVVEATRWLKGALWGFFGRFPSFSRRLLGVELYTVCSSPSKFARSVQEVFPPHTPSATRNQISGEEGRLTFARPQFSALSVRSFRQVTVLNNSRFNSVLSGNSLMIPPRVEDGPWRLYMGRKPRVVAGLKGQRNNQVALAVPHRRRNFTTGLFIGTRAPYNWYHWIANNLPALHVANEAGIDVSIPLFLPSEVSLFPQMLESLEIFLGDRPVIWLTSDEAVDVEDLVWADSPVYDAPFAVNSDSRVPLSLHYSAMQGFRDRILSHYSGEIATFAPVKRVFLARSPGSSRPYSQDEVLKYFKPMGFEEAYMDQLSFGQQVALLHGAETVAGPSGAAFANILFSRQRMRALRLIENAAPYENYFSNLAWLAGSHVRDSPCLKVKSNTSDPSLGLDLRRLERDAEELLKN